MTRATPGGPELLAPRTMPSRLRGGRDHEAEHDCATRNHLPGPPPDSASTNARRGVGAEIDAADEVADQRAIDDPVFPDQQLPCPLDPSQRAKNHPRPSRSARRGLRRIRTGSSHPSSMNSLTSAISSAFISIGACPVSGITTKRAFGPRCVISVAVCADRMSDSAPRSTITGALIGS